MRTARAQLSERMVSAAKQAASIAAISGGVATLSKRLSAVGDRMNLPTGRTTTTQTRKAVQKSAKVVRRAPVTRRGWALMRGRGRRAVGPLEGTQRRVRRSMRWVRLFTLGFALGAIWAYLFAPRRQSAAEQHETARQQSSANEQPSAAQR